MSIQGLRDTDDIIGEFKDRPENWRLGILLREPNGEAPLFALTSAMKTESTDDAHFHWFEEEMPDFRVALNADIDDSQTTFTLVSGANQFKNGDVLRIEESDEQVMVTTQPTVDTTLVVSRGFAGSTAAAVLYAGAGVNPNLQYLGSAYEEGALSPPGRTYNPVEIYNYTEIFRNVVEITNTAKSTRFRTGDPVKEDRRRALNQHSQGVEMMMIHGLRSLGTGPDGKPRRTMNGVLSQIPTELEFSPTSDTLDMETFEEYMTEIFRWGSSEKMAFGGLTAIRGLQQMARRNSSYEMLQGQKEFGMNLKRFVTPGGELVVKSHPMFQQNISGVTTSVAYNGMDTWLLVLDMKNLKYRFLDNRDTKFLDQTQEKGRDGIRGEWLTECSIQVMHGKTHAIIKNITAGAADA